MNEVVTNLVKSLGQKLDAYTSRKLIVTVGSPATILTLVPDAADSLPVAIGKCVAMVCTAAVAIYYLHVNHTLELAANSSPVDPALN